jgi:hypothetical protein
LTSQLLAPTARRIPIELQRLMAEMTLADRTSVTTKRLVNAFGWTDGDMREQHDVQELNRLLFDAIHRSLVGTPGAEMVCDQAHASVLLRLCATSPLVRQSLCIRTIAALTSVCAQHSYRRTHNHTNRTHTACAHPRVACDTLCRCHRCTMACMYGAHAARVVVRTPRCRSAWSLSRTFSRVSSTLIISPRCVCVCECVCE